MSKTKVFWFHYNKPASKAKGKPQISVHYNKTCHIVDGILIDRAKLTEKINKSQPFFVIKGRCESFKIVDNVCYIVGKL